MGLVPRCAPSADLGVGHHFTASLIVMLRFAPLGRFPEGGSLLVRPPVPIDASGVGQNPDALSDVGSAGIIRAQHTPLRIEPHFGQVSENSSKPSTNEHWGVLHEDESRSHLANDPSKFRPEARAGTVDPCSFPRGADVLAGEASAHDIGPAPPGVAVEGANVIPHGEPGEDSVSLALEEDRPRVFLQLDGAHRDMAKKESSEDSAPGACEEMEFTKWNIQGCLGRVMRMDRRGSADAG